ncbi:hypothetical protein GF312_08045, partial [Candidatus Poribacteria bacterium]|nr:hypothetical protein [Candidatus Poribacteria bacterium]
METENPDIQTFLDLYDEFFKLALYIRSLHSIEKLNKLYERFIELFNQVDQESRKLRIPDVDIQDANYAVAGFIDEIIGWESRLEQEFFGRNVAGEEFFNKLDKIKEEKRTEVLAVYYICLVLGFEGMYFRSPQKLQDYINKIHS